MASTRTLRSCIAAVVLLSILVWLSASGAAAAGGRISSAQRDLAAVEQRIADEQHAFEAARARLQGIAARTVGEVASYDVLQQRLMNLRDRVQGIRNRYADQRNTLDARAREAFMQGPASDFAAVLGASSMGDLMDRVEFLNDVAISDA